MCKVKPNSFIAVRRAPLHEEAAGCPAELEHVDVLQVPHSHVLDRAHVCHASSLPLLSAAHAVGAAGRAVWQVCATAGEPIWAPVGVQLAWGGCQGCPVGRAPPARHFRRPPLHRPAGGHALLAQGSGESAESCGQLCACAAGEDVLTKTPRAAGACSWGFASPVLFSQGITDCAVFRTAFL